MAKYDAKGWNEDTTNFSSYLMGKYCSVTVVNIVQEEMMLNFAVDVVFPDLGKYLERRETKAFDQSFLSPFPTHGKP